MSRAHAPTPRLRECRTHAYVSTPAVAKGFLSGEPWSDMVCLGVKAEEVQKHG